MTNKIIFFIGLYFLTSILLEAQNTKDERPIRELFQADKISTFASELSATFATSGTEIYFSRSNDKWGSGTMQSSIYYSQKINNEWTEAKLAAFSGRFNDSSPHLAQDGKSLYFISKRPLNDRQTSADIWVVKKEGSNEWGEPVRLHEPINSTGNEYSPRTDREGNLYFASDRPGGYGQGDIYFSKFEDGKLGDPVNIGQAINSPTGEWNLEINQDGDLIIFEASEQKENISSYGDLYISFKLDTVWSLPQNMKELNTSGSDLYPELLESQNRLYYSSSDSLSGQLTNIYEVDFKSLSERYRQSARKFELSHDKLEGVNLSKNKDVYNIPESGRKRISSLYRNGHSMAYHRKDSILYVFGGADEEKVTGKLYVLKDSIWDGIETNTSPQARTFASLCYDFKNNRLIIFGGNKVLFGKDTNENNLLNDTWEFSNGKWKKLETKQAPSPRAEMAMSYDEDRGVIVLFGGYKIEKSTYIKLGDTWELSDNEWNLVSLDGPSARNGAAMAYNAEDNYMVLHGGSTLDNQYGEGRGETWIWNGNRWRQMSDSNVAGVYNCAIAYDKKHSIIRRFGGWNGQVRIDETWSLNRSEWNKDRLFTRPLARNHSGMVYDEKRKGLLLYGGHDGDNIFCDVWLYKDEKWIEVISGDPIKRIANNH